MTLSKNERRYNNVRYGTRCQSSFQYKARRSALVSSGRPSAFGWGSELRLPSSIWDGGVIFPLVVASLSDMVSGRRARDELDRETEEERRRSLMREYLFFGLVRMTDL